MKSFHPALEPAVIGVDVLNMEDAFDHPFPVGGIDRSVGDFRFPGHREVLGKAAPCVRIPVA